MSKIFFVCPDHQKPAGGIKQIYRQVEVLNHNHIKAYVLHGKKPFKIKWFKNNVPVLWDHRVSDLNKKKTRQKSKVILSSIIKLPKIIINSPKSKVQFSNDDIIVLPEYYGKDLDNAFSSQSIVIYNQNCYYTFRGYDIKESKGDSIYHQNRLKAVIVASEDALGYLNLFLKNKPLHRIKYGIDHKIFSYSSDKKKQIAFMPRKLKEDALQILNIIYQNQGMKNWDLVPIEGLNEQEVAEVLRDSAIFLSFNHREGFGMPPAEAMSCGCIVVGYSGQGGNEYFKEEFTYKVPQRNIIVFVNTLEEVIHNFNSNFEKMIIKGKKASDYIQKHYSMEKEESTILYTWRNIMLNHK